MSENADEVTARKRAVCEHESFAANVDVHRLSQTEGGPVDSYSVDVRVQCSACGEPFQFIGLDAGLSFAKPMVSVDGTELRCPIAPQSLKVGPLDGVLGFGVRPTGSA